MDRQKAEEITETVKAAWSWEMEPETFAIWTAAVSDLNDAEAAELGVIALYKSQAFRPTIADVVDAYNAQRRRVPAQHQLSEPVTSRRGELVRAALDKIGAQPTVGGDSTYGKVCREHRRWVGTEQTQDVCWPHVHAGQPS